MSRSSLALFDCPWRGRFCGNEVAGESVPQNHSIMVHLAYVKPADVPDKLCIFPGTLFSSGVLGHMATVAFSF